MSPQKIGIYRKTPDFSACIGERRPQLPSCQSWAVKMVAIATAWQCVALNQQLEDAGSAAIICPMPSAWKLWYMFCSVCQLSKFTNAAAHMSDFVVQTGATGEASSTAAESARGRVPQMSSEVLALSRSIPTVNRESLCSKSSTFLQSFWIITLSALSPSRSAFVLGGKLAGAIGNTHLNWRMFHWQCPHISWKGFAAISEAQPSAPLCRSVEFYNSNLPASGQG